jgi:hypothetical protein
MVASSGQSMETVCNLLGLDFDSVVKVLTTKRIEMPGSVIHKPVTPESVSRLWPSSLRAPVIDTRFRLLQAVHARDAMARYIYGKVFNWIVARTNDFLGKSEPGFSFVGEACFPSSENFSDGSLLFFVSFPQEFWTFSASKRLRKNRIRLSSCASTTRMRRYNSSSTSMCSKWSSNCTKPRASRGWTLSSSITQTVWVLSKTRSHQVFWPCWNR